MGDGASVEGISRFLGSGSQGTTPICKLHILAAADDDDNISKDDYGMWYYCQIAKGGSMIGCENPSCAV